MFSTFFGIEIGKRALLTQQLAQSTVAHNIANAVTPGYSRQQASLRAGTPLNLPYGNRIQIPGQLGTGVEVSTILRVRDMLLERQILRESAEGGTWETQKGYLALIESIMLEPSANAVGDTLNEFWAAWQELSVYPDDLAVRQVVISRAQNMIHLLQGKDRDLAALQQQADQEFRTGIDRINSLASQIRDLNIQINQSLGVETPPNDLLDQRDVYLRELAGLVDFTGHVMPNGLYAITINGHTMVQDETFIPLQVVDDPLNNNFAQAIWSDDATPAVISQGSLQGLTDIRDTYLPSYRTALDDLALGLMNSVNPLHAAGFALNAAAPSGQGFFTGTGLQDLEVNPILVADATQIAAATNPLAPGDGSNALAIAQLQNAAIMSGGTQTLGEFYQGFIAQIGLESDDTQLHAATQTRLVSGLKTQQESNAGVNLDEEMTNMIRYQDAYQAAVRVVTSMDEMLNTIINHMGLVGR